MRNRIVAAITAAAALMFIIGTGTVAAATYTGTVYTITNDATANAVTAYHRHADGSLTWSADYATRGHGTGAGLGSQGALTLSANGRWLVAVNAGSNTISDFAVREDGSLRLASRAWSVGTNPISVTIHDRLVYVLDAGGQPNVAGFRIGARGQLQWVPGTRRRLSAGTSPEQVGFNPDGSILAVTEKGANNIVTFSIDAHGRPSPRNVQASSGAAPYGFAFDPAGHLLVSEAAVSAVSSYAVSASGDLSAISPSVVNGQGAACWLTLTPDGSEAFAIDTHTSTISSYAVASDGSLTLDQAAAGSTGANTVPLDATVSSHGPDLYVLVAATHQIAAFTMGAGGSLTPLGVVAAPAAAGGLISR